MVWAGGILGGLLLLIAGLWAIGRGIDREHVATVARDLPAPPDRVWALIAGPDRFTEWRPGLKKVEVTERDGDRPVAWTEHSSFGPMPLRVLEWDPPRRLVGRIDSDDLGFGGTWTWEIAPRDGGSTLTITERGWIDGALFRFLARNVFGYDGTMKRVQADVAAALEKDGR